MVTVKMTSSATQAGRGAAQVCRERLKQASRKLSWRLLFSKFSYKKGLIEKEEKKIPLETKSELANI